MNAIQFIQQHGVDKAREVVECAPEFPVFGYCALTGSYIFKRKDATAYYHNETNSWSEEYAIELIFLDDLKRLVESMDYVAIHGYEKSKEILKNAPVGAECYSWSIGNSGIRDKTVELVKLKQAIADYESIGGEHV